MTESQEKAVEAVKALVSELKAEEEYFWNLSLQHVKHADDGWSSAIQTLGMIELALHLIDNQQPFTEGARHALESMSAYWESAA